MIEQSKAGITFSGFATDFRVASVRKRARIVGSRGTVFGMALTQPPYKFLSKEVFILFAGSKEDRVRAGHTHFFPEGVRGGGSVVLYCLYNQIVEQRRWWIILFQQSRRWVLSVCPVLGRSITYSGWVAFGVLIRANRGGRGRLLSV